MAYTKTPLVNTEQTTPIALKTAWNSRGGQTSEDSDNLNVIFEPVINQLTGDKYFEVMKRDGVEVWVTLSGNPRASFHWKSASQYVVAVGGNLYGYDVNTATLLWTTTTPGPSTLNQLGFADYSPTQLVIIDNQFGKVVSNTGVATAIAPPPLVSGHLPYPVVLDGYLFIASGSRIYNSVLNDPTDFTNNEYIEAEDYADSIKALGRLNSFVVAFGTDSIQFFYDNANEVGTPLNKHSTTIKLGFDGGLAEYGDSLIFVGHTVGANVTVFSLSDFKPTDIGNATFSRWFSHKLSNIQGGVTYIQSWYGEVVLFNGHPVYIPTLYLSKANPIQPDPVQPLSDTYGVDLSNNLWGRFQLGSTNTLLVNGSSGVLFTTFQQSAIYKVVNRNGTDDGTNYDVQFITPIQDFGTHRLKFGTRIVMWADQTPTPTYSLISWSKDDYQTYTIPRSVDMSHTYQQMYALGSFRKVAFKVTYNSNTPMRWKLLELDYSLGQA